MQRRMQRRMAPAFFLAAALLALIPLSSRAEELSTPAHPAWLEGLANKVSTGCNVWTGTDYYDSAAHTNRVGACWITCSQFDFIDPTFGTGATCTGTSSAYTVRRYSYCPNGCR